jgi:predicted RNA-binding protein with PUA-like domain
MRCFAAMATWLIKSEPDVYSIDSLAKDRKTRWTGVRNFQARNHMMAMAVGDPLIYYHSSADPPGVAGLARVCRAASPDELQFDPGSDYFEPRASAERPVWQCVEVAFVAKARPFVPLPLLKAEPGLEGMELLRKGSRLSVQPVSDAHFKLVCKLAGL